MKPGQIAKRGDLVQTWFNTGAFGYQYLYGVVITAGPHVFTVEWESGLRNRRPQGCHLVELMTDPEMRADALKKLKHLNPNPEAT